MVADLIRVDYEQIAEIARRCEDESSLTTKCLNHVRSQAEALAQNGWHGANANRFYDDLEYEIFPAMQKLITALSKTQTALLTIAQTFREAEEEGASYFNGNDGSEDTHGGSFISIKPVKIPKRVTQKALLKGGWQAIQKTEAGKQLIEEAKKHGVSLYSNGEYLGGAAENDPDATKVNITMTNIDDKGGTLGSYSNDKESIRLDSSDLYTSKELASTLAHEIQHAVDYAAGRVTRDIDDAGDVPDDFMTDPVVQKETFDAVKEDIHERVRSEMRSFARGEAVANNKPYTLKEPISDADVEDFLSEKVAYRKKYEKYYTEILQEAAKEQNPTGSKKPVVDITRSGKLKFKITN